MKILRHREVKILAQGQTASRSPRTGPSQSHTGCRDRPWALQSPEAAPEGPLQPVKATPSVDSKALVLGADQRQINKRQIGSEE